jgi:ribosomal protein L13
MQKHQKPLGREVVEKLKIYMESERKRCQRNCVDAWVKAGEKITSSQPQPIT